MKKRSSGNSEEYNSSTAPMLNKNNVVMNVVQVAQPRFFDFMRVHKSAPDPIHFSTSSSCSNSTDINNNVEVSSSEETSGYIC